jgi:hypothetical protein
MLFSAESVWTMIHGVALGGGALMALAAALFVLFFMDARAGVDAPAAHSQRVAGLTVFIAAALWLTVIGGTYIVFPPYRAPPPEGLADLSQYPRAFLLGSPETTWLHAFAMETKEHVPWIAAIFSTAAAFVSVRHRSRLLNDPMVRRLVTTLTATCFVLVSYVALLGVFVNKVAPLE